MASAVLADFSVSFDPLRDKSYRRTRLGRSVVDFLAWKKIGRAADRTLDQYERDLARGALMFPKVGVEEFGIAELLHVAASFRPKERRVRLAAYRSFFKWAIRMDLRTDNPCDKLPDLKREPQRVVEVFTDVEIQWLCGMPLIDGALFQILFDTGIRKEEARGLRLEHFKRDLAPGEFKVRGKGDKERVIPATLAVATKIDELIVLEGLNSGDHFWYGTWSNPSGRGIKSRKRPIGEGTFHRWWERCLEQAGIAYRNPHTTRHTFATRYLRHPAGRIHRLQMAMGHESIKTTVDLYGHLDTGDLRQDFAEIFG